MNKLPDKADNASLEKGDFSIPPEGLTDKEREQCFSAFSSFIEVQREHFLGYQANQKMDYMDDTKQFLNCHVNNVGDPFTPGNLTVNSKVMEQAVLDYYATLWNAKLPHDPSVPDSYWGYVLTMGSTEGNLYGMFNARDYLAGYKLEVDDKTSPDKRRTNYIKAKPVEGKDNAYTPVALFSDDTHYSIIKAMRVLKIQTFHDIGKELYPDQNPLDPGKPWPKEVPSKDGNDGPGCVDVDKLKTLVEFFAKEGYPIMICCNYGTTFKGAYDDVESVGNTLMPIFKKYGLKDRKVEYEKGKTDIRNGYWIHVDGALGAAYMPFIEMANKEKVKDAPKCGPVFDFRLDCVNSLVMSGHKWPGAPWPCGIFMTKVKYQLFPPDDPEYLGSPDTTFAGSRNGFSSIILWDYLARSSYKSQIARALSDEAMAKYAEEQLKTVQKYHPELDLWVERTPLALTVRFRKPNDWIIFKYSLSCETLLVNKEVRPYAHIFAMDSANKSLIDQLVNELKDKDAFDKSKDTVVTIGRGRGFR